MAHNSGPQQHTDDRSDPARADQSFNPQANIIAYLSKPEAYGLPNGIVERHETHGSIVFLAGEYAYKLKRAVRYPYMDYSSVERRRSMCEAELVVNRRLAPELYINVRPVICNAEGTLHIGSPGEHSGAVDWLVVMRRFQQDTLFEAMRQSGTLTLPQIRALAERIATVHLGANPHKELGGIRGITDVVDENVSIFRQMEARPFDSVKIDLLEKLARNTLAKTRSLLELRRKDGHVRRCHGDLHLNNICLFEGQPVLFDAIEFREDFSCIDVLYDLAFLLMDLDHHGLRAHANVLLNCYLERTDEYAGLAALPLFLSCRAAVRAHVTISAAKVNRGDIPAIQSEEAINLLDRAIHYLQSQQTQLIAIGGLSGTGKSTLAANLAPMIGRAPGAIVVRTDVVRKQLWGIDELSRLPMESYDVGFTRHVYATVEQRAGTVLEGGYCVVADAVFGNVRQRAQIENLAKEKRLPFYGFWLDAPVGLLEQRLVSRQNDASDATVEVLHTQLTEIDRPKDWVVLDASGPAPELVARAARWLGLPPRTWVEHFNQNVS